MKLINDKIKCPHCNREIEIENISTIQILEELKSSSSPHTLSSLSRKLSIPRTTLTYHLNNLKSKGKIKTQRLENLTGRPTIIILK